MSSTVKKYNYMRQQPQEVTFLNMATALSILIGIIYLIILNTLDLDTIRIIRQDRSISGSLFKYSVIFWILLFIVQYFVPKRKKISFKIVGMDLLYLLWCFYIYSLILENAIYNYNNTDETSFKTEKLNVINRDSESIRGRGSKGRDYTAYYLDTDSKDESLKRISVSNNEYYNSEQRNILYVHYYKGKLGSTFITLDIPTNSIEENLVYTKVDTEKEVLIEFMNPRHFPLFISCFLVTIFLPLAIILFYIPGHKIDIPYKTLLPIAFSPCLLSYILYLMLGWSAFVTVMTCIWLGMWSSGFLAVETRNLATNSISSIRKRIGNGGYYVLLTFLVICVCVFSFFWMDYLMDIFKNNKSI